MLKVGNKNQKIAHENVLKRQPIIYKSLLKDSDQALPTDITSYEMLFKQNKNKINPESPMFIDADNDKNFISYGQLQQDILLIAAGLKKEFNLQYGDVVALCCPNTIHFPSIFHGTVCAGGIIAAIPHSTSNFRAQDIIDDLETIKPKVVVLHPMFLDKVLPLLPSVGVPESHVLLVGEEDECKKVNAQGVRTIQKLFLSHRPDFADLEKLEKDACYRYTENDIIHAPSYLFFTSGSTGKRKAVMITQYAAVSVLVNRPVDPSNEAVKILACNKLFHVSSLILALHLCVYNGDKVYVINKFLLEDLCIAIEKYKINSMMALFYNISEMCSKSVADKYDLSSLIVVYNIGTKLHHSAIQKLKDRHNLSVIDTYGLTETLIMFQNNMEYTKKGGAGVLARGYEARLVDEDGDDVPRGEIGQLCIKGPTVCLGYYNDPAATASTFDSEGYIMTGDLLRCDKQGLFHYIDRYKDMIRYYESSIFPTSIESVLVKHPMILECAVVGIKVPAKNIEIPKAFIRLIETQILDETEQEQLKKEIIKYIGDRLPDEMRLRGGVSIVDSFPRTYSGKIRRFTLKVEANQMELISKK